MESKITPDFYLPTEIYIRNGIIDNIDSIVSRFGSRVVIITTVSDYEIFHEKLEQIYITLKNSNVGCIIYDEIPDNPNTEDIDIAVSFIKKTKCEIVIGFGGYESINTAKAISILLENYKFCHDLFSYPDLQEKFIPLITMPAYPIFGFEIAPALFLEDIHDHDKMIYINEKLFPVATIVDPELSLSISEEKTMKTAISTLSIATESVISKMNNDIINTYALKSIDMIFKNLLPVYGDLTKATPRTFLSTASVMSGIAFSVASLSASLSIALAISSKTDITIESSMSLILPHVMEFNLTSSPGKYVQMSKVMGEDVKEITVIEAAIKSIEAIRKIETDIEIPMRLTNYNISKSLFPKIAELAASYPFLGNAVRAIDKNEIETILIAAY